MFYWYILFSLYLLIWSFECYIVTISKELQYESNQSGVTENSECVDKIVINDGWLLQQFLYLKTVVTSVVEHCNINEDLVPMDCVCLLVSWRLRPMPVQWSSSRYRLGPSPLWVSRVFDTSEFSGKLFVGNEITHLNGHALLGISPDHFAEMMQDIGENEKRIMTVEQIPSEIDL